MPNNIHNNKQQQIKLKILHEKQRKINILRVTPPAAAVPRLSLVITFLYFFCPPFVPRVEKLCTFAAFLNLTPMKAKAKEPVKIRFKELANGNRSIFLDIYTDGTRQKEYLKLYLVPEKTPFDKQQNLQTMTAANAIKAQRVMDIANGKAGISNTNKSKILLLDWLKLYTENKNVSVSTKSMLKNVQRVVMEYAPAARLCDVTREFCRGYVKHLQTSTTAFGGFYAESTVYVYCTVFNGALNEAVRAGIIETNPFHLLAKSDKAKAVESKREHLTIDELKRLENTQIPVYKRGQFYEIRRAFLFSCFCGLRFSDINSLEWQNITEDNGQIVVTISQQKTSRPLYLPLSDKAVKYLNYDGGRVGKVFDLPNVNVVEKWLKRWAAAAGIEKAVTFHVARHTFATSLLTLGGDLYTVSKLLGHTNISTTQIYAKIVDEKKTSTVNLFNTAF